MIGDLILWQTVIYILSNPVMSGLLKIGYTFQDVQRRAQELSSSTGVPTPFEVEYYCFTRDVEEIEKEIHFRFGKYRLPGREFFTISLEFAVKIIDSMIRKVADDRFCRISIDTSPIRDRYSSEKNTLYMCPKCGEKNSSSKICVACGYVYG
ncbi:MAG TPA: GIY-YIG nuclease family protein [Ignavibacteriaceae bacterium]|nr:GIY-YIG nuclease family protein [Ignavibacteriaceae bacterium]